MSNYFCRFCLINCKPEDSSLFSKQITEMIEYCIPEFEIELVTNPIICVTCHNLLKQAEEFKKNCLDVQERIKKQMLITNTSSENVGICLNNLINSDANTTATNPEHLDNTSTSFRKSYKYSTSSVANSSNNYLGEKGVPNKIINEAANKQERNHDHDEFLNLLESSANIKMEMVTDKLVKSAGNSYSNFYDDDPQSKSDTSSGKKRCDVPLKKRLIPKKDKSSKTINNPLDVLFEKLCCISCELRLNNFESLIRHLYSVHQKAGELYTCIICRYKAQDFKNIRKHYQRVHRNCMDLKGSCLFCITDMHNYSELYKHMRKEHSACCSGGIFHCNSCDFASRKYDIFRRHFFRSHDFICNYCLKSFESIKHLNKHIGRHSLKISRASL